MAERDDDKLVAKLATLFREKFDGLQPEASDHSAFPEEAEARTDVKDVGAEHPAAMPVERRQSYRKNLRGWGFVLLNDAEPLTFQTTNLSLGGLETVFVRDPGFLLGDVVNIHLPALKLQGWASVAHSRHCPEHGHTIGFRFTALNAGEGGDNS